MKLPLLFAFLCASSLCSAQSLVQTLNSGSVIAPNAMVSIGEIVVIPQNQSQSNSGIIGILAQINQQTLEVTHYDLTETISVYPNPTVSKIYFNTVQNLADEKVNVYTNSGQLVLKSKISADNSLNLNELSSGIYLVQFSDKKINSFKIIKH